jgi:hypothetical protein
MRSTFARTIPHVRLNQTATWVEPRRPAEAGRYMDVRHIDVWFIDVRLKPDATLTKAGRDIDAWSNDVRLKPDATLTSGTSAQTECPRDVASGFCRTFATPCLWPSQTGLDVRASDRHFSVAPTFAVPAQ